jgi:hypothetical protein
MELAEVNSTLSRTQLLSIYGDHSDYDLVGDTGSAAACRIFIKAGRLLLRTPVTRSASASKGEDVEVDVRVISEAVARAERWLIARRESDRGPRNYTPAEDWRSA